MRMGAKTIATNYTPRTDPVNAFKATVRAAFHQQTIITKPLDGPLACSLLFLFPRPAAKIWKKNPMPREWCERKPDLDNLLKSVFDALNGLAFHDDRQIVELLSVRKKICDGEETPGVRVVIKEAG